MQLTGLHHLTAVTGDAPANLAFYTDLLGLRLVKKTVNQDDVSAYHLFYADGDGSAGSEVTFFDWPWASPNRLGAGAIAETSLRVDGADALTWWADRFAARGVSHGPREERAGRPSLPFADPEGQRLRLVDDGGAPGGAPWSGSPVPPQFQIKALHAVALDLAALDPTAVVLTEVLGFRPDGEHPVPDGGRLAVFATGAGGPGAELHLIVRPGAAGRVGVGGVHHVAFRTPDDAEHRAWGERLAAAGLGVTPQIDRYYFRSLYFREPGGVLFEIATDGPGFATDEDPDHLGEGLALPPFLEPRRAEIQAGLRPLPPVRTTRP